jgi:prolyl-tRNA editing enzyme YbaK/EbsC (Cys-tRNA(Pro) deacylase)
MTPVAMTPAAMTAVAMTLVAATVETTRVMRPMTEPTLDPLVQRALLSNNVAYEVLACDPDLADTAAFCAHYGFALEQAANTILVASKKVAPPKYAACVVLGTTRLDVNKKVSELLAVKRLSFADAETTADLTGMMIGGVTAFGIGDLPVYVDSAVMEQARVVMGGGNRSSKILLNPNELRRLPNVVVVESLAKPKQ